MGVPADRWRANRSVRVLADREAIFAAAAAEWTAQAEAAIAARGQFKVALAGGSTPKGLYDLLAGPVGANLPWDKTFFFFGDERHVPPDHADSNFRMAQEALLSRVPVPGENIFRVLAEETDAHIAAAKYDEALREFFGRVHFTVPRFDLILLGMGPDGHTASLFPGSSGLAEEDRWVIANWVEKFNTWRITFTYPVLNAARCVLFMAAGADKAAMLHTVLDTLEDDEAPMDEFPSRYVRPAHGDLIWMVDAAAGLQL